MSRGLPRGLEDRLAAVRPVSAERERAARVRLDALAKPPRSLGKLETIAARLAAAIGLPPPPLGRRVLVVAAADHGVAKQGVSAYPTKVTGAVLRAMAKGGAAVAVLARAVGAEVIPVDVGVARPVEVPGVISRRVAAGSRDLSTGPALSADAAERALEVGFDLGVEIAGRADVVGLGEVGIGNTTSAAALAVALAGLDPVRAVGPGTGIGGERLANKRAIVAVAAARVEPAGDAWSALCEVGGLEIGALAGVALGAAAAGRPVVLDGYATGAAALVAGGLRPEVAGWLFASHRSAEPGHGAVLEALGLEPALDLAMRLGEGTGAALVLPILDAAGAILREMATLDSVVGS